MTKKARAKVQPNPPGPMKTAGQAVFWVLWKLAGSPALGGKRRR